MKKPKLKTLCKPRQNESDHIAHDNEDSHSQGYTQQFDSSGVKSFQITYLIGHWSRCKYKEIYWASILHVGVENRPSSNQQVTLESMTEITLGRMSIICILWNLGRIKDQIGPQVDEKSSPSLLINSLFQSISGDGI